MPQQRARRPKGRDPVLDFGIHAGKRVSELPTMWLDAIAWSMEDCPDWWRDRLVAEQERRAAADVRAEKDRLDELHREHLRQVERQRAEYERRREEQFDETVRRITERIFQQFREGFRSTGPRCTPTPGLDPWVVLGVPPTATREEARAAFRRQALERHPDRGGSVAAFQELATAWEAACRLRDWAR